MFCAKCQSELSACTCPDIEQRLRSLQQPGSHVHIPDCPACKMPVAICKCGYSVYHRDVVEECVKLLGELNRPFFDQQCTYEEGFAEGRPAAEEAEAQYEALT